MGLPERVLHDRTYADEYPKLNNGREKEVESSYSDSIGKGTTGGLLLKFPVIRSKEISELSTDVIVETKTIPFSAYSPAEHEPVKDVEGQFIIRKHFSKDLIESLEKIQHYIGNPNASIYAEKILSLIRELCNRTPYDPFLDVVMALYDAMVYKNFWSKYTAEQYDKIRILLVSLINIREISDKRVDNALLTLEKIGLNTLPFELDIDLDPEDSSEL